ncbi:MAG: hypothetical protein QXI43_00220 [Candidatus Nitrosocaldus sp.]
MIEEEEEGVEDGRGGEGERREGEEEVEGKEEGEGIIECNAEEFNSLVDELLLGNKDKTPLFLFLFTQEGCSTCTNFTRMLNEALQEQKGIKRWREKRRRVKREVFIIEIKGGEEDRKKGKGGGGGGVMDPCLLIHDMYHIHSTPTLLFYDPRMNRIREINIDSAKSVDDAVRIALDSIMLQPDF